MSEFSDRPFVAGSLTGLRSFDVDALGRLRGVTYPQVFAPGENVAVCGGVNPDPEDYVTRMQRDLLRSMNSYSSSFRHGYSTGDAATGETIAKPKHVTAGVKCGCGFYAYFDGGNDYSREGRVTAVIEGYGVCTIGTRGFRAEKARLVGLVIPSEGRRSWRHPRWFDRLADWTNAHGGMAVVLGVLSIPVAIFSGSGVAALAASLSLWFLMLSPVVVAIAAACPVLFKADMHGIDREFPSVSDTSRCPDKRGSRASLALVGRNYPDVPVYPTTAAALAARPLTPPPVPSPDEDENFWTRSAR